MIKHIFFDLDRTLWDFEKNSEATLYDSYLDLNLEQCVGDFTTFLNQYKIINDRFWNDYRDGKVDKEVVKYQRFIEVLQYFGVEDEKLGREMARQYLDNSPLQTNLFPGVVEALKHFKKESYQLHVITNGFKEEQNNKLKNSGIKDYFEIILCSEEVGVNKPNPKVFYEALRRAGAKVEESIMVGDDFHCDVLGAENVGMQAILFDPLQKHPADKYHKVREWKELIDLIIQL